MTFIESNLNTALIKHLEDFSYPSRVDVISSYITKEGLEAVWYVFDKLAAQHAQVRAFTTLQRGITDIESLERLAGLLNTKVYTFWPQQPNFHSKGMLSFGELLGKKPSMR